MCTKPSIHDVQCEGPNAQRLLQLWEHLYIDNGVLKRKYDDVHGNRLWMQLFVPHSLKSEIMEQLHSGTLEGHLKVNKTVAKIRQRFYWPGMYHDVEQWVSTCHRCATRNTAPQHNQGPLQTIKVGYPLQLVAVNILGPLPESNTGNWYILIAADYFTNFFDSSTL